MSLEHLSLDPSPGPLPPCGGGLHWGLCWGVQEPRVCRAQPLLNRGLRCRRELQPQDPCSAGKRQNPPWALWCQAGDRQSPQRWATGLGQGEGLQGELQSSHTSRKPLGGMEDLPSLVPPRV